MNLNSVCVLLATYNGKKYLNEQIESILKQKGVNITLLVRDDSSTDGTIDLLNQMQDEGKLTWFTTPHTTIADAFFTLMQYAPVSEYYAFCDQDDIWDEDKLIVAIEQLNKYHANIPSMYCCGSKLVNEKNQFICNHRLDKSRSHQSRLFFSGIAGNTMVFNETLKNIVLSHYPKCYRMHDSWVYKVCLCVGGNIIIDPEPHLNYRQHGNNVVGMETTLKKKCKKFMDIIKDASLYPELEEIYNVYNKELAKNYSALLENVINNKKNFKKRWLLITDKSIYFNNFFFSLGFKIKVILKKL